MNNLVNMNIDIYLTCPECQGQEWLLNVDKPGYEWRLIKGIECKYCDFKVKFWMCQISERGNLVST